MYCNTSNVEVENSQKIEVISTISCALSILGAIVIFLTYTFIPEIRKYASRKLVLCLTIADTLTPLGMCDSFMCLCYIIL